MTSLSVCILTKNEGHNIEACLQSIASIANEIIIIDSESTDNTIEICKRYTDNIITQPWLGCGPQREIVYNQATSDWVLFLDADERVSNKLAAEIATVLKNPQHSAYEIPFHSYYCGKRIRFGDWMNEKHTRLLKRNQCKVIPRLVHFGLDINGKVGKLRNSITHYSFPNIATVINKMHTYSTAGALHYHSKGKRTSMLNAVGHGFFTFIRSYVLRLGFLDGRFGFMLAVSNAEGSYYKYVKLLELQNNPHLAANTSLSPSVSTKTPAHDLKLGM